MELNTMLNEICKISALKATSALSKFLQTPLGIDINPVEVNKIDELNFIKDNNDMINLFLPITGKLSGASYFLYSKKSALALCDILFHRAEGSTKSLSEPEKSALAEVTNVVMGNFLTPFAQSLQIDYLMHRTAVFEPTNIKTIFNDNTSCLIKINFSFQHLDIKGYVYIILEEGKIDNFLKNRDLIGNE